MIKQYCCGIILVLVAIGVMAPVPANADDTFGLTRGQVVYVPAYSHIYAGNNERPFLLAVTLSIRNIDPNRRITIVVVTYHASQGRQIKQYLDAPVTLNPLESLRFVVPEKDKSGGSGANFIVEWISEQPVNPPIIESINIGTQSGQGISFTSRGRVLITSKKK
jgi:hypothetical protein